MTPDDQTTRDEGAASADQTSGSGGSDDSGGQPRHPETGHFLPKDADPEEYIDEETGTDEGDEAAAGDEAESVPTGEGVTGPDRPSERTAENAPPAGRSIWPSIPGRIAGPNVFVTPNSQARSGTPARGHALPPSLLPGVQGETPAKSRRPQPNREPQPPEAWAEEPDRTGGPQHGDQAPPQHGGQPQVAGSERIGEDPAGTRHRWNRRQ